MIETSSRKRDLTRMVAQARASHGQRHVPRVAVRIDQQERGRGSKSGLERGIGSHQGPRRHAQLRLETGQRFGQAATQSVGQGVHPIDRIILSASMRRRLLNRRTFVATSVVAGWGVTTLDSSSGFRFLRRSGRGDWPRRTGGAAQAVAGSWSDNAVTLAWLGHATVLINFYGVRILTDPTLYPRIGSRPGPRLARAAASGSTAR